MQIDQVAIAVLGTSAAWLSQARAESFPRWACIFACRASRSGSTALGSPSNREFSQSVCSMRWPG